MNENYENHLEIYPDRSELHIKGHIAVYYEGFQTRETQERYKKLNQILTAGYLPEIYAKLDKMALEELSEEDKELLRSLVQGVTSEVGRALVGVAFLQLTNRLADIKNSCCIIKGIGLFLAACCSGILWTKTFGFGTD